MNKDFLSFFEAIKEAYNFKGACLLSFPFDTYIVSLVIREKKIYGCDINFFKSFLLEKGISQNSIFEKETYAFLSENIDDSEMEKLSNLILEIFSEIVEPELSISINIKDLQYDFEVKRGIDLSKLIVELCENYVNSEILNSIFTDVEMSISVKVDALTIARNLPLKPYEGFVLTRIIDGMKIKDLIPATNLGEEKTLRSLLIFWIFNLIELPIFSKNISKPAEKLEIPPRIIQEIENFYKLTKVGNCFQIFDLPYEASKSDIKKKFVMLTQKFHPDKYQKYEDETLLRKIDSIFSLLTECYEKLKDDEQKKKYVELILAKENKQKKHTQKVSPKSEKDPQEKPKYAYEDPAHKAKQHYIHGKEAFKNKKYFDAMEHFREAVRMQPEIAEYQYWLGKTLTYNPKKLKEAEERLLKAIELKPNIKQFYLELARLYAKVGLHIKCKKMYEKVYELDPENEEARVYLKVKKKKKITFKDLLNMDLKNIKDLFKK